ncbi:MAG: hypothetical protein N2322_04995, partial [Terrimicrobiaceae bacterium]|nr:hypothetical protein [Terrimicrobiaceae bacterium]
QTLVQTAKDWIDHATQENYDNWYYGSAYEQGLFGQSFGAAQPFGQVGVSGHAHAAWQALIGASLQPSLHSLAKGVFGAAVLQTAFHNTNNHDLSKFSTGAYINPDIETGQTLAGFARNSHAQARFAAVYARVQQWASSATASTLGTEAADVDLDGAPEYLLFNSRLFALFEARGGRMTAAWMRDPFTGRVWQMAGNFAAYSNTDTEEEGASNFVGNSTSLSAYRTSGFKDWWTINTSNTGSNAGVNAMYSVAPAASGTGWTFSHGGVTKTVRIPQAASERLEATYQLSGLNKAFIRFGLSPNLQQLLLRGHEGLGNETLTGSTRVALTNSAGGDTVRAWVEAPAINAAATDVASTGFTTVLRRNQAQTHQVEVELTGAGPHVVTLGFDLGYDITDSDGDGLPDSWENEHFGSLAQNGEGNADGDGLTNFQEYVFGSNPASASSGRPATSVAPSPEGFVFSFLTIPNRWYQPQVSTDLQTWSPLGARIAGDGSIKSVTDPVTGPRRFYRVHVTLP